MKKTKAIAVVSTALMMGSICWLLNTQRVNGSLEAGLQKEKLRSESLLSEKLLLEKDIQKLKDDLFSLKGRNLELDNLVRNTSAKLEAREADYNRIKKETADLALLRKQRQELIALKSELENELQSMKISYAHMEARNNDLLATVASLEERNRILASDLTRAMVAAVDGAQIEALKGKQDRLTVKARRARKLKASFEVPQELTNLSFRITDSNGHVHSQKDGNVTFTSEPTEDRFMVSADPAMQSPRIQKVAMVYEPDEKMKPGIYTVEIMNDNLYVGSLKVKLK